MWGDPGSRDDHGNETHLSGSRRRTAHFVRGRHYRFGGAFTAHIPGIGKWSRSFGDTGARWSGSSQCRRRWRRNGVRRQSASLVFTNCRTGMHERRHDLAVDVVTPANCHGSHERRPMHRNGGGARRRNCDPLDLRPPAAMTLVRRLYRSGPKPRPLNRMRLGRRPSNSPYWTRSHGPRSSQFQQPSHWLVARRGALQRECLYGLPVSAHVF
jgi:hypothetical protein